METEDKFLGEKKGVAAIGAISREKLFPPGNAAYQYWLNFALMRKKDGFYAEAEKAARESIKLNPEVYHSHAVLSNLLFNRGRFRESLLHARRAAALKPNDPETRSSLLRVLRVLNPGCARKIAVKIFKKDMKMSVPVLIAEKDGAAENSRWKKAALKFVSAGKYKEAFQALERLNNAGAALENQFLFYNLFTMHGAISVKECERYLRELSAMRAGPELAEWRYFYMGRLCEEIFLSEQREGFLARALGYYAKLDAKKLGKRGWMLFNRGKIYLGSRPPLYSRAESDFIAVLEACPGYWPALCRLAEIAFCRGRRKTGLEYFEKAIRNCPGFVGEIRTWRGEFLLLSGRFREALEDLDFGVALGAKYACGWRGAARLMLGDTRGAVKDLMAARKADPWDLEAKIFLAEALRERGAYGQAEEELRGLVTASCSPWIYANTALVKFKKKKTAAALADFSKIRKDIIRFVRLKTKLKTATPGDKEKLLVEFLKLSKGCRRQDAYLEPLWMK
ncbi:MAG: tetratricopeptide repeat protein [Elusimicrobia bacterium]|nr:tetratricopeptide repeat protein [Elusimicrobiota bacterium]